MATLQCAYCKADFVPRSTDPRLKYCGSRCKERGKVERRLTGLAPMPPSWIKRQQEKKEQHLQSLERWRQRDIERSKRRMEKVAANRDAYLTETYSITAADYDRMSAEQQSRCAICGTDQPGGRGNRYFAVDHDHQTGQVRGLLCFNCNTAIGKLNDDVATLQRAVLYLTKSNTLKIERA